MPWNPLLLVLAAAMPVPSEGPNHHLFLSPGDLQQAHGVALRVHPPAEGERVLEPDRPWESGWIPFYSTVRDEGGRIRLWYDCRDHEGNSHLGYAESTDGVHWTKPALGLVDFHGSKANNLMAIESFEGTVTYDAHAPAAERYLYLCSLGRQGGIFRYTSPDGLRWKRDPRPLLPFDCDSQNVVFWDDAKGKYELYLRSWGPKTAGDRRRRVVHYEADRLDQPLPVTPYPSTLPPVGGAGHAPTIGAEIPVALECDDQDPPHLDIYTNAIQPYPLAPDCYLGFPAFFRHWIGSPHPVSDGWTEAQFVASRDGRRFERFDRATYVDAGPQGPFSGNMVFPGFGLVVRGDEIWQYATRFRTTHGDVQARAVAPDGALYRFVQRIDGFVAAEFENSGGSFVSASVQVDGPRLRVNAVTGAVGDLAIELEDEAGRPLPGFGAAECLPIRGDSTHFVVSWRQGADLGALRGHRVRLAFSGSHAALYSFYFGSE